MWTGGQKLTLTESPTRPVLRYHGGKWKLAPWILQHLPPHRVYVEPYGGAASILLRKPRAYGEVYNEIDGDVVNLFRVLRDEASAAELKRRLELTPFAREEFESSYQPANDNIDQARLLVVRAFMGFGSNGHCIRRKTGFRANSNRSGTVPAHDWANYPDALKGITERIRGVVIENRDAIEVMLQHDGADTLHYVDPPYVHSTRAMKNPYDLAYGGYAKEMNDGEHEHLLSVLMELRGMVVLSGYPSPLYDETLAAWHRVETAAHADGARPRQEVLWLNAQAADALEASREQPSLFASHERGIAGDNDTESKDGK